MKRDPRHLFRALRTLRDGNPRSVHGDAWGCGAAAHPSSLPASEGAYLFWRVVELPTGAALSRPPPSCCRRGLAQLRGRGRGGEESLRESPQRPSLSESSKQTISFVLQTQFFPLVRSANWTRLLHWFGYVDIRLHLILHVHVTPTTDWCNLIVDC